MKNILRAATLIVAGLFTLPAAAQVNLTMPSASDTMVGRATTDTLTNKTINCSNNTCVNFPGGSGTPAGSSGDFQTNSAGSFGALTPGAGIATWIATPSSANLLSALTTKTGTGLAVFGTSPVLVTPNLGTPSAAVLTSATGLPVGGIASIAANSIVMNATGSGASPTAIAMAACADTGGNHLNYTAGAFSCGTSGGSGTLTVADTHAFSLGSVTTLNLGAGFIASGSSGAVTIKPTNEITTSAAASYAITTADANTTIHLTHATPTPTIQASATLGNGYGVSVQCDNVCTLTPLSGTINGAASLALAPHQTTAVWTDGATTSAGIIPATDPSNASNLISGTVPVARLGTSGTRDNTTVLYGDNVFRAPAGGGNVTGSGASTTGDLLQANNTGTPLNTATDTGIIAANVLTSASTMTANTLPKGNGSKTLALSTIADGGAGVTVGSPTGGAEGAGTINAVNVYVNGVAVGTSGGNVSNSGTPLVNQIGLWVDSTHIKGNPNLIDDGSTLTASQAFALSGSISPTALAADVNDYAPAGNSTAARLRVDAGGADRNVTGLAGGAGGIVKIIYNAGATNNLLIKDENASSTAANRFHLGGNDISIGVGKVRAFTYDATLSRWTNFDYGGGNTGVTAGSYTSMNATVSADGRITAASNGAGGGGIAQMNTGTGVMANNGYVGTDSVSLTFATARPWLAQKAVTVSGLTCISGAVQGTGVSVNIDAFVWTPSGTSLTVVDQSAAQRVTIGGTTTLVSTTVNNNNLSLNAGDLLAFKTTQASGSLNPLGLMCSFQWQ